MRNIQETLLAQPSPIDGLMHSALSPKARRQVSSLVLDITGHLLAVGGSVDIQSALDSMKSGGVPDDWQPVLGKLRTLQAILEHGQTQGAGWESLKENEHLRLRVLDRLIGIGGVLTTGEVVVTFEDTRKNANGDRPAVIDLVSGRITPVDTEGSFEHPLYGVVGVTPYNHIIVQSQFCPILNLVDHTVREAFDGDYDRLAYNRQADIVMGHWSWNTHEVYLYHVRSGKKNKRELGQPYHEIYGLTSDGLVVVQRQEKNHDKAIDFVDENAQSVFSWEYASTQEALVTVVDDGGVVVRTDGYVWYVHPTTGETVKLEGLDNRYLTAEEPLVACSHPDDARILAFLDTASGDTEEPGLRIIDSRTGELIRWYPCHGRYLAVGPENSLVVGNQGELLVLEESI